MNEVNTPWHYYPLNELSFWHIFAVAMLCWVPSYFMWKKDDNPGPFGISAIPISLLTSYGWFIRRGDGEKLWMPFEAAIIPTVLVFGILAIGILSKLDADSEDPEANDQWWYAAANVLAWAGKPIMLLFFGVGEGITTVLQFAGVIVVAFVVLSFNKKFRDKVTKPIFQPIFASINRLLADGDTAANAQQSNTQGTQSSGGGNPPPSSH